VGEPVTRRYAVGSAMNAEQFFNAMALAVSAVPSVELSITTRPQVVVLGERRSTMSGVNPWRTNR
jgi:hypothetical protein